MWAQSWNNLGDLVKPYPNKPSIDVTDAMVKQGWTAKIMFQKADEFFQSMGLPEMPKVWFNLKKGLTYVSLLVLYFSVPGFPCCRNKVFSCLKKSKNVYLNLDLYKLVFQATSLFHY